MNKLDKNGKVVRNKERLVAPVARIKAICILLLIAAQHDVRLYQMDVKSVFLNGTINEVVYVEQPPSFWSGTESNKKGVELLPLKTVGLQKLLRTF